MSAPRSVEFPTPKEHEVILGLRRSQVVLATALLVVGLWFAHGGTVVGEFAGIAAVVAAVCSVSISMRGRGVDQWIPVVVRHGIDRVIRAERRPRHRRRLRQGTKESVVIEAVGPMLTTGVLVDRGVRSIVMEVHGGGLALLGDDERARRVDGLNDLLDAAAGSLPSESTLQFLVVIDHLSRVPEVVGQREPGEVFSCEDETYREALRREGVARNAYLAVHLHIARSRWHGEHNDHDQQINDVYEVLASAATSAGIVLDKPMSPDELRALPLLGPLRSGCTTERFSTVFADGRVHSTAWIEMLPSRPTSPGFLGALLTHRAPLVLSILCRPIPAAKAARSVEAERVAQAANATLAARGGFLRSAKVVRHDSQLAAREHDVAAGHATFRVTAYLRVSAPDRVALQSALTLVKERATASGLSLTLLNGDQRRALRCTLPLGVGVR